MVRHHKLIIYKIDHRKIFYVSGLFKYFRRQSTEKIDDLILVNRHQHILSAFRMRFRPIKKKSLLVKSIHPLYILNVLYKRKVPTMLVSTCWPFFLFVPGHSCILQRRRTGTYILTWLPFVSLSVSITSRYCVQHMTMQIRLSKNIPFIVKRVQCFQLYVSVCLGSGFFSSVPVAAFCAAFGWGF